MREKFEKREMENLSKYATKSVDGIRERHEEKGEYRLAFQVDRDRIYHSKAFRRLMHKTQVFISPTGDHYRTRLTHTLEVSQIARSIARNIRANEDLAEAISLGHDIGHTPFGHTGEDAINEILKDFGGFKHNKHSVKVVREIEKNGRGLNLTIQTLDGIKNHGSSAKPMTIEGEIVKIADKIAYVNHDIEDAICAKLITEEDLPKDCVELLGNNNSDRIDFIIKDIVTNTINTPHLNISDDVFEKLYVLRKFLRDCVYRNELNTKERNKIHFIIESLYNYYMKNLHTLPKEYLLKIENGENETIVVCDYIAGMTDRFAIHNFNDIFVPKSFI